MEYIKIYSKYGELWGAMPTSQFKGRKPKDFYLMLSDEKGLCIGLLYADTGGFSREFVESCYIKLFNDQLMQTGVTTLAKLLGLWQDDSGLPDGGDMIGKKGSDK